MKKQFALVAIACATLITSCGGEEKKEEKETVKTCKTYNKVDVPCEDMDNIMKIEELVFTFVRLDQTAGIGYAEVIAANDAIFAQIEPLMPSLAKVLEADPEMATEYFVEELELTKKENEDYKTVLTDLENLVVKATWEQDPIFPKEMDIMVRFTNTSTKPIGYMKGMMTYLDAEGNVLVEGEVGMYPFHFTPKIEGEGGIPVGYEGTCDMGLNLEKEKRGLISTITFKLNEVRYK